MNSTFVWSEDHELVDIAGSSIYMQEYGSDYYLVRSSKFPSVTLFRGKRDVCAAWMKVLGDHLGAFKLQVKS